MKFITEQPVNCEPILKAGVSVKLPGQALDPTLISVTDIDQLHSFEDELEDEFRQVGGLLYLDAPFNRLKSADEFGRIHVFKFHNHRFLHVYLNRVTVRAGRVDFHVAWSE